MTPDAATYDPDLWDEEQLVHALSRLQLRSDTPAPLGVLRAEIDALFARPIDDARLVIGGVEMVPGALGPRREADLGRSPPHVFVALIDDLGDHRFALVPMAGLDAELTDALGVANGCVFGDARAARPATYPSLLRVVAGTIEPEQADVFWAMWVLDWFEEWAGVNVALPSLNELRSWAGTLRGHEVADASWVEGTIARVCAIYVT